MQERRNECINLVRVSNRKINLIRFGDNEGKKHADMKQQVCELLQSQGKSFITEAIFKTGGRADILVLDDFRVIEILDSENIENLENKKKMYPTGLCIDYVYV